MAKRAEKGKEGAAKASGTRAGTPVPTPEPGGKGESVAAYFRKVFAENPRLLKERSNDELFRRWLADHPGHEEVPQNVKTSLQNIKSVLRNKKGKKGKKGSVQPAAEAPQPQAPKAAVPRGVLEKLE